MTDFTLNHDSIIVRAATDNYGPFRFHFPACSAVNKNDGEIPYGDTINTVEVKTYLGTVDGNSTLSGETEITDLIDSDHTPAIVDDYYVSLRFQYPSGQKGQIATIYLKITTSGGMVYPFFFNNVEIQ